MKKELDEALVKKYPKIFRDRYGDMKSTAMYWGFECGDGWYNLIDTLCSNLQFHTDKNGYPQVVTTQIKEKYGRLCFYCDFENVQSEKQVEFLMGTITFAEQFSTKICEECGLPGTNKSENGWYRTNCEKCRLERENAKDNS